MLNNNVESQILPFFYTNELRNQTAFDYISFSSYDGFLVYATGSLYGSQIENLQAYLKDGLTEVQERFNTIDLPILDRMKESIFQSGDFLANHLISASEVVDDVDFSVCLIAFKDGVVYVWIDGTLNVRIYRGGESLLINSENKPQFNGSAQVELGDVLAVSFTDHLVEHDSLFEDYVLEKNVPSYPSLYIDYQLDINGELTQIETDSYENVTSQTEIEDENELPVKPYSLQALNESESEEKIESRNKINIDTQAFVQNIKEKLAALKESDFFSNIGVYSKKVLSFIFGIAMGITSAILDFIYKVVLRKNSHQFKRFQNSYQKKNLQYLLILVIVVFSTYALFFTPSGKKSQNLNQNGTSVTKTQEEVRANIQAEFDKLTDYFDYVQIENFNSSFATLKNQINAARSSGFSDTSYLDTILTKAQSFEDTLFKVTPITKVDDVFFATNISNAQIVDFALVGNDVYALDKANSQVLKSATGQQFEIFASDPRLSAMNQISCGDGNCYILDESRGLAVLNLAKKTFEIFPNTSNFSLGVTESIYAFNRLYTLVPGEGKVMKYDKSGQAFTAGEKWNTDAGFTATTADIAIDGNIFELDSTGVLRKFYRQKVDVSFEGLQESNPKLGSKLQMSMSPARDAGPNVRNRLYITDSDNKMIAVYDKDINSMKQFSFKGVYKYRGTDKISFDNIIETQLSSDEQSLYLLGNNMVFKVRVTTL